MTPEERREALADAGFIDDMSCLVESWLDEKDTEIERLRNVMRGLGGGSNWIAADLLHADERRRTAEIGDGDE